MKALSKKLIDDNEKKYGKEIRAKYGDEQVDKSNQKVKRDDRGAVCGSRKKLAADVLATLAEAFATGDPAGELAQKKPHIYIGNGSAIIGIAIRKKHMQVLRKCM
ncbi:hypothetical protein GCM10020331_069870 [Ectobacillus funiculus]